MQVIGLDLHLALKLSHELQSDMSQRNRLHTLGQLCSRVWIAQNPGAIRNWGFWGVVGNIDGYLREGKKKKKKRSK